MNEIDSSPVLFDERQAANGARIGIARLNAVKSLNSLTLSMIDLLLGRFTTWATEPSIAMVMLEAAGDKALCAGADLHRLHQTMLAHHASALRDDKCANSYALAFFSREYRLDHLIHTYPKPFLCWGHGIVMGGGVGMMSGASHRVVTESARVAMPEISIGLFPDVGGTWLLNRAPGHSGLFLALTGAQLNADDALFTRLADYKIAHADKPRVVEQLLSMPWSANKDENHALLTNSLRKIAMTRGTPGPLRANLDLINDLCDYAELSETMSAIIGVKTEDPWLAKAAVTLAAGSPGSAALAHALQKRLLHSSLAEVFRVELVAALTCAMRADLAEGIRALLIDKDRNPRWQPASVHGVTAQCLDGFFASPWRADQHPLRDLA